MIGANRQFNSTLKGFGICKKALNEVYMRIPQKRRGMKAAPVRRRRILKLGVFVESSRTLVTLASTTK